MRLVCVFEAVYVCVCAGQSKTGSIVKAFETLLTDKVENPKKSVHFSRFEDGATHHRVIIFNVLVGPSLVKASLHDRAPKDAAKKVHISHKHQLARRRVHVGKCNCQMDGFKIWNYSILFRLCSKPRCGNAMDQTWAQTTMHFLSENKKLLFGKHDLKICENSAVWVHVVQLCYKFIAFQHQCYNDRMNFGCSIFFTFWQWRCSECDVTSRISTHISLSSWTNHHQIISSLPFPSSAHFCTPRTYLA